MRAATAAIIFRQFSQYVLVGGIAFVADFCVLFLLTDKLGWHYLSSATAAFLVGLAVNYVLCITWVFDVRAFADRRHEFIIFGVIGIAGLILNNLLMYALTDLAGLHYLLSKIGSAGLILIFNFGLRRAILFTEKRNAIDHAGNIGSAEFSAKEAPLIKDA
jgi:putative flippase GtrA